MIKGARQLPTMLYRMWLDVLPDEDPSPRSKVWGAC